MIEVEYAPSFVRQFKKLDSLLQGEILTCVELFRNRKNHAFLEVHKLHGAMAKYYSFSVQYRARIIFKYARNKQIAQLLAVGGHEVYD